MCVYSSISLRNFNQIFIQMPIDLGINIMDHSSSRRLTKIVVKWPRLMWIQLFCSSLSWILIFTRHIKLKFSDEKVKWVQTQICAYKRNRYRFSYVFSPNRYATPLIVPEEFLDTKITDSVYDLIQYSFKILRVFLFPYLCRIFDSRKVHGVWVNLKFFFKMKFSPCVGLVNEGAEKWNSCPKRPCSRRTLSFCLPSDEQRRFRCRFKSCFEVGLIIVL